MYCLLFTYITHLECGRLSNTRRTHTNTHTASRRKFISSNNMPQISKSFSFIWLCFDVFGHSNHWAVSFFFLFYIWFYTHSLNCKQISNLSKETEKKWIKLASDVLFCLVLLGNCGKCQTDENMFIFGLIWFFSNNEPIHYWKCWPKGGHRSN